jgi:hypothetical protein
VEGYSRVWPSNLKLGEYKVKVKRERYGRYTVAVQGSIVDRTSSLSPSIFSKSRLLAVMTE